MIEIKRLDNLDLVALHPMLAESVSDGFELVRRLHDDYRNGTITFSGPREALFAAFAGPDMVGVAGVMWDPRTPDPTIGRVRRVYVMRRHRRHGVGGLLLRSVIDFGRHHYETLVLNTASDDAGKFYESIGFSSDSPYEHTTHIMRL